MSSADSALIRFPLSGVSVHNYAANARGQACKIINITIRVTLVVLGVMLILKVFPTGLEMPMIVSASSLLFLSFVAGSNLHRRTSEVVFEFMLASVCAAMMFTGLTNVNLGIGIVSTLGIGLFVGMTAERGMIQKGDEPILPLRVFDYFLGIAKDLSTSAISIVTAPFHKHLYKKEIPAGGEALCVLIHGLASRPSVLNDYHFSLLKHKNITVFHPHIHKNGLCKLEEAVETLTETIQTWAYQNRDKPIFLIGHSNGGRIAADLSIKLTLDVSQRLYVHCIAAPLAGTKFVDRAGWPECLRSAWQSLFRYLYTEDVFEELSHESEKSKELREGMITSRNHYHFYATPSDALVFPIDSALPKLDNVHHHIVPAEGHQGIVYAVHQKIMEDVAAVLRSPQNGLCNLPDSGE